MFTFIVKCLPVSLVLALVWLVVLFVTGHTVTKNPRWDAIWNNTVFISVIVATLLLIFNALVIWLPGTMQLSKELVERFLGA